MRIDRNLQKKVINFLPYTYSSATVMAILLIVFIAKGIYPFGLNTIDYADMGQANVPMYYHLHDAMHGTKSLFFDWYTALGINMAETVSVGSLLTPFNLFFFFVPRKLILQSLSIFTMIKMMAMAASMFIFLHKKYSANIFWKVLFGVSYAFSGFALQYYTNNQWLDVAAMFPLLILGLDILFQHKRYSLYVIMLTMCLIANLYCAAMILLFVFFIGGLYLLLIPPKKNVKNQVCSFGLGTLFSLGLSAFILVPAYKQMTQSMRLTTQKSSFMELYKSILDTVQFNSIQKWWMLLGTALASVIIVKGIVATRKDKKTVIFIVVSIFTVTLPICFENINLMWHGGSYVFFPLRFGYMISFVVLSAACYFISKNSRLNEPITDTFNARFTFKVVAGLCIIASIVIATIRSFNNIPKDNYRAVLFSLFIIIFIVLLGVYTVILHKNNLFFNYRWFSIFLVSELLIGAYVFIAPPAGTIYKHPEQSSSYVQSTNVLRHEFDIKPSQLNRIKNVGNTLNNNYPFILQRAALSNWTHTVTGEEQDNLRKLGYSTVLTRLNDSGGTVFSDALLNIKQTLSTCKLDENLYTLVSKNKTYHLYNNNYTLPFGLTIPGSTSLSEQLYDNCFEYQNAFFEQLSGQKELIRFIKSNCILDDTVITRTSSQASDLNVATEYSLNIPRNQALYFYSNDEVYDMSFFVQGVSVPVPSTGQEDNTQYPTSFNDNLICLGAFSNEVIKLKVIYPNDISEATIQLGLLDLEKLETFTQNYDGYDSNAKTTSRGIALTVNGTAEKDMLFLPVSYDTGWSCMVNGQKIAVDRVASSFLGVHLQNGENRVKLTFVPSGIKFGSLVSLATLLLMIIGFLVQKKIGYHLPQKLLLGLDVAFFIVWSLGVILVYVIPVGTTIFQAVLKIQ